MPLFFCARVRIAEVSLDISFSGHYQVYEEDAHYNEFFSVIKSPAGNDDIDVSIEVVDSAMPDIVDFRPCFDGEAPWKGFSNGEETLFSVNSPDFGPPFLWMRCASDYRNATIHVNRENPLYLPQDVRVRNPMHYPLDQLLLMHLLALNSGALVHASSLAIDGGAWLFPGRAGAGKSTLFRQFSGRSDVTGISDERVALRKCGGLFNVYGTPWPGENHVARNIKAPLAGICFMKHSKSNEIKQISAAEAVGRLLPVVSIPWYDRQASDMVLSFCDELLSAAPLYELSFRPGPEAAELVIETARRTSRS
jgi:hypothetical protein